MAEYYRQIDSELSKLFLNALSDFSERIRVHPKSFPLKEENIRMAPINLFSVKLFYELIDKEAYVLAVLHTSQEEKLFNPEKKTKAF